MSNNAPTSRKVSQDDGSVEEQQRTPPAETFPRRVCFPFIGDLIGGSYLSGLLLTQHLDRARYEPIIVLHEEGLFASELRKQGIAYDLVKLPSFVGTAPGIWPNSRAIARSLPTLYKYLRRRGISIVHTNEWPLHQTWALPARLSGGAFFWHQRGSLTDSRLDSVLIRFATRFVCVSDFIENQFPEKLKPRSARIDNPFEVAAGEPARANARSQLCDELGISPETTIVGFFGNFIERKRADRFIEAAAAISSSPYSSVTFVLFGDDREERSAELKNRAQQLSIDQNTHFMGFRTPGEYWLSACDLLLVPAIDEPFGRTLIEAMLHGVPVVATDSGGNPEIITDGETGILVAPDDPGAMADAALALINNPDRAQNIAANAKTAAQNRFSAAAHARRIEELYDETLAQRAAGRAKHKPS